MAGSRGIKGQGFCAAGGDKDGNKGIHSIECHGNEGSAPLGTWAQAPTGSACLGAKDRLVKAFASVEMAVGSSGGNCLSLLTGVQTINKEEGTGRGK